jgi:hypothetical protein
VTVPRLVLEGVRRRDRQAAAGALAILASLLVTAVGFVAGISRERRRQARPSSASERQPVTPDAPE